MTIPTVSISVPDSIDKDQVQQELADIFECLEEIRKQTGYGALIIEIQRGEIYEITVSYKRRRKKDIIKPIK
jgi:hypothetical protein